MNDKQEANPTSETSSTSLPGMNWNCGFRAVSHLVCS